MKPLPTIAAVRWIGLLGLIFGLSSVPALGQPVDASFRSGIAAMQAGAHSDAIRHLQVMVEAAPAYYLDGQGSAAYWLGRAYEVEGDSAEALRIWEAGLDTLAAVDRIDPRLNEAYLQAVFHAGREAAYPRAARAYLDLLQHAQTFAQEDELRIAERHVAQMLMLWPEDQRPRLVENGKPDKKGRLHLLPEAGATITAWWRGQDLELATDRNERLEEHLRRVALARQRYRYDDALTGFDDRGTLFVRLGEPDKHEVVTYQDSRLLDILGQGSRVKLYTSDMPKNEVWYYPGLYRSGLYVFVYRARRYQRASTTDLIPRRLRSAGPRHAPMKLVAMMQYLNLRLGEIDLYYGSRYAGGINDLLIYQRRNRWYMDTSVLSRSTRLDNFLYSAVYDVERDDADRERDREDNMPQQTSQLFDDLSALQVAFRFARFLDDDGVTRTELFWSHLPDTSLSAGRVVQLTAVQKGATYRTRTRVIDRSVPTMAEQEGAAYVHTRALRSDTAAYHLHLQWDLYDRGPGAHADSLYISRRLGTNVFKADSLRALNPDPARLEMSDLLPSLDVDPERLETPNNTGLIVRPYPLPNVTYGTSPALYFEVYHLTFDADDLTRYSVEYEIERREKGGVWRLFQPQKDRTTATLSYTGTSRTAREYVVVDLTEADRAGRLKVTVRVTDEVSGHNVERAIEFDVVER